MQEFFSVMLCVLSVFGLYAIFARLAAMLLPKNAFFLAVDGTGLAKDEILLLVQSARLVAERQRFTAKKVVVVLAAPDNEKEEALRKEGILVYTRKSSAQ